MQTETATVTTAKVHVFAHLGPAPYRYLGVTQNRWSPCQGVPSKPGGTCDHCSAGIEWEFRFEAANGHRFIVGSSCVEKGGDSGLRKVIASDVRKHQADVRAARDARVREEVSALIVDPKVREALVSKPHPNAFYAEKGKTLADYYDFMLRSSGAAGRARCLKALKAVAS